MQDVVFSIVSHQQLQLVDLVLSDLYCVRSVKFKIVLTINVKENEDILKKHTELPIMVIRNAHPKGFGSNHNSAFKLINGDFFVIINPDVRLEADYIGKLISNFSCERVGAVAPVIITQDGFVEDSVRPFPTVFNLIERYFRKQIRHRYSGRRESVKAVDWVAGMFVVFRGAVYESVSGFDESYFMYCEDIDICARIKSAGYRIVVDENIAVIHNARRASRKSFRHFYWHLVSMWKWLARTKSHLKAECD
jgi:N-acetylglucosaminyl-diphospho-decaprenol L-rhamnosyltransferase